MFAALLFPGFPSQFSTWSNRGALSCSGCCTRHETRSSGLALDEGHDKLPMRVLLVALLATLLCQGATAQYPSRPIRLLVGFPPGGGPDIVARLLAPKLADTLGQPVVVENRVGSTGTIAGEAVAKSPADGHTLLVGHDGLFVINPHLYKQMPIDPLKDLMPVTSLVSNGFFMAVNPSVPARTFPEFIEYARRANPPLQYASGGNGSRARPPSRRGEQGARAAGYQGQADQRGRGRTLDHHARGICRRDPQRVRKIRKARERRRRQGRMRGSA